MLNLHSSEEAEESAETGTEKSRRVHSSAGATTSAQKDDEEDKGPWKALSYRLVGPFRGGRVLPFRRRRPGQHILFRRCGRRCLKTTDGGLNWKLFLTNRGRLAFDRRARCAESDPNVMYVGTGEACIRGNIVGGNACISPSTPVDLEACWTWRYARHRAADCEPKNPDIAFVAALGHPFGDNEERGVFRTRDGGKTWEKVLYKTQRPVPSTSLSIQQFQYLFAALWQARRTPGAWIARPRKRPLSLGGRRHYLEGNQSARLA